MAFVYILEFGSQTTDLIGKRLEEMGVPVKYGRSSTPAEELKGADGVIISGGPKGANQPDAYPYDPRLFQIEKPVLGICYGHQLGAKEFGARLHKKTREYGETEMLLTGRDPLLEGFDEKEIVWMNHGDSITDGNFSILGYTEKGVPAMMRRGNFFGVQYHPEVTHTEKGKVLLGNFARACGFVPRELGFDADNFIEEAIVRLKEEVGDATLAAYLSGGVDSTAAVMLAKMAGLRILPVYMEMGNGRKGEANFAYTQLSRLLEQELYIHDRAASFVAGLYGIHDSEAKRKAFQKMYDATREEIENQFDARNTVLFDGTIETDKRESGQETRSEQGKDSGTVDTIKTHHNTGKWKGRKASPLANLTKERTRIVARRLGLPAEISERQPFPGPGLFVRISTGYYEVPTQLFHYAQEISRSYDMDAFVLPRKSVGLKGDSRALEHAAVITGAREWKNIRRASKQLIEDLAICRVLYAPSGQRFADSDINKAAPYELDNETLYRLREVTDVVEGKMDKHGVVSSQTPVITFGGPDGWINVIRDVNSKDFRTLRPLRKPDEFSWECYEEIDRGIKKRLGSDAGITTFDVSDKPGGTTEWE